MHLVILAGGTGVAIAKVIGKVEKEQALLAKEQALLQLSASYAAREQAVLQRYASRDHDSATKEQAMLQRCASQPGS